MPTKDKVTEEMKQQSQYWLNQLYRTITWCHVPSTVLSFIIELYEVLLVSATPMGCRPTDKLVSDIIGYDTLNQLRTMRNTLSHNLYNVEFVFAYVRPNLITIGENGFNDACHMCGLEGDVWKELMNICSLDEHNIISHIDATPTLLKLHLMSEITGE